MSAEDVFGLQVEGETITLAGDLDAHTAPRLDEAVGELIRAGADRIVIRMADVEFVDSSGLRSMIRARNEGDAPRTVVIEDPSPATVRLLELTGMTDQFTVSGGS